MNIEINKSAFLPVMKVNVVKQNSLFCITTEFLTELHYPRHVYKLWPIGRQLSRTIG